MAIPPSGLSSPVQLVLDDAAGPSVRFVDADGAPLSLPEPLVRWQGAAAPGSRRVADGTWEVALGPDGLAFSVSREPAGRYGEHRFRVDLRNEGQQPVEGVLLPPLAAWADDEEAVAARSAEWMVLRPAMSTIGSIGTHRAWTIGEFAHDYFAIVPGEQPGWYLCAALLRDGGKGRHEKLTLAPGETATYRLHLDGGRGDRNAALQELFRVRGGYRVDPLEYDFSEYADPRLAWATDLVAGWLNWAWDKQNLDPRTGDYRLADSLAEARRLFGGYDAYMIWPFWPRAGFDARFQLEHFREMPGGLDGLRREIERCHDLGVRIIVSHCIWSETDRDRTPEARRKSFAQLVDLACDLGADGVLMDVMSNTPAEIREMARARGTDLLPYAEGDPTWSESQTNLVGRIHNMHTMPYFNLKKYMLPHHPQLRVCEPGNAGRMMRRDFVLSFFNGHGVEINTMFPQDLPACHEEWPILARALDILRTHRACFASPDWQPLVPTLARDVWANRWPAGEKTLYTLCCVTPAGHHGPLLRLPRQEHVRYVDLWRDRPLVAVEDGDAVLLNYDLDGYTPGVRGGQADFTAGCIGVLQVRVKAVLDFELLRVSVDAPREGERLAIWRDAVRPDAEPVVLPAAATVEVDLFAAFGTHTNEAIVVRLLDERGQLVDEDVVPEADVRYFRIDKPARTAPLPPGAQPAGMVRIPGTRFDYTIVQGAPNWMATYSNPGRHPYAAAPASATRPVDVASFWIDRYPVTNAQYAAFLAATGYRPRDPTNFLAHFEDGRPPKGREGHPVVYVDYDDAKAYAAWSGKRLPTEEEWLLAAGGHEVGRVWPWGGELEEGRCNRDAGGTTPVDAHLAGASPFGVEDLVGNVWQWTASLMDNGRHQIVFVRGGSWYRPPEGSWWVKGGPRGIRDHHPLPLFGPAMNRFATVGFRCARDE